jgi:hypothetical protein
MVVIKLYLVMVIMVQDVSITNLVSNTGVVASDVLQVLVQQERFSSSWIFIKCIGKYYEWKNSQQRI